LDINSIMRTTLTIDDDVIALLKRAERERGLSFKQVVNEALRRGLSVAVAPGVAEPLPSYRLGSRPGIDLTKSLALAEALEDEALSAKQTLGK